MPVCALQSVIFSIITRLASHVASEKAIAADALLNAGVIKACNIG